MDEAEIRSTSTADGVRIAYWTCGRGPPVVVLHPPAMSNLKRELAIAPLRSWYERLGEQSRVVRLSQRGFGSSQRDGVEVTLDNFVRDVEAVVEALAVEQVGILASAIGSPVAVAYAARHPERVAKLVLFSPFLGYAGDELAVGIGRARAVARLGTLVWTRTVAKWLDPGGVVDSQAMQAVLTESVSADAHGNWSGAIRRMDVTEELGAVRSPTLVIMRREEIGDGPPQTRGSIAIAGRRELTVDGSAIVPYFEGGEAILSVVRDFLLEP